VKKKLFFTFLVVALLAGCNGPATTADGLPILRVNDRHLTLDNYPGEPYEIRPGKGFALDLAGYRFRIPASLNIDQVNSIQIAISENQIYSIPIQQTITRYPITTASLIPIGNSIPFTEVTGGETITIGVGYTFPDGRFYPAWMGIVSVRENQP
jgi:hypothetical protein